MQSLDKIAAVKLAPRDYNTIKFKNLPEHPVTAIVLNHPEYEERSRLPIIKYDNWAEGLRKKVPGYRSKNSIDQNFWIPAAMAVNPKLTYETALEMYKAGLRSEILNKGDGVPYMFEVFGGLEF